MSAHTSTRGQKAAKSISSTPNCGVQERLKSSCLLATHIILSYALFPSSPLLPPPSLSLTLQSGTPTGAKPFYNLLSQVPLTRLDSPIPNSSTFWLNWEVRRYERLHRGGRNGMRIHAYLAYQLQYEARALPGSTGHFHHKLTA